MLALISDIHSNTIALKAVLDDIAQRGIDQIVCLGDVIGYGPNPRECLDMVMSAATVTLMGNHDYAVMYEPSNFNIGAESACFWTRQQLAADPGDDAAGKRWDFLGSLPIKQTMDGSELGMGELTFVHGSPRRPVNEYIFPDDVYNAPAKVQQLFERFEHLCFVGHTHVPGVFLPTPDFYSPDELENVYEVSEGYKALVNVGSVGQPRDRDVRASYVVLEPGKVRFVRVSYDVDAASEEVYAIEALDDYLGTRLKEGR
jgi:predicted phosphodiesterase